MNALSKKEFVNGDVYNTGVHALTMLLPMSSCSCVSQRNKCKSYIGDNEYSDQFLEDTIYSNLEWQSTIQCNRIHLNIVQCNILL
jgi:hypothetical protein